MAIPKTIKDLYNYTNSQIAILQRRIQDLEKPAPPAPLPDPIPVSVTKIDAGSNKLFLPLGIGVKIGDTVILKDKCIRGTVGLGGQFPNTLYKSTKDLVADVSHPPLFYAGSLEDGLIYRKEDTGWLPFTKWGYFLNKIVPLSLRAKVTDISTDGRTITLDKSAKISATGFEVYKDYAYEFQNLIDNNLPLPEGKFAIGQTLIATEKTVEISGAGIDKTILFSPDGTPSISIQLVMYKWATKAIVRDMTLIGNARDNGYGFRQDGEYAFPEVGYIDNPYVNQQGVAMWTHGGQVLRVKCVDCLGYSIQTNGSGCLVQDCDVEHTTDEHIYQGWAFHSEGDYNTGTPSKFINCTFKSPFTAHGWESFKSQSCEFINCKSINGIMALNGASNVHVKDFDFKFTKNNASEWFKSGLSPVLEMNSFLDDTYNILLENVTVTQEPYDDYGHVMKAIYGRDGIKDITIKGGSSTTPNMNEETAATGVLLPANNCVIDGFKVNGTLPPFFHTTENYSLSMASITMFGGNNKGVIKNCNADVIRAGVGVVTENNICSICK